MEQRTRLAVGVTLLLIGGVLGAGLTTVSSPPATEQEQRPDSRPLEAPLPGTNTSASVGTFESERAFRRYVQRGQRLADQRPGPRGVVSDGPRPAEAEPMIEREQVAMTADAGAGGTGGSAPEPDRVSSTNVQEQGLDEPDILKTDGSHVYYAPKQHRYYHDETDRQTHIIAATPPSAPTQVATVESSGRLFRSGDRLVVIEADALVGYDVSDPDTPQRVWENDLADEVVTARLTNGSIYLVTKSGVSLDDPCPIEPMGEAVSVPCTDVYHPRQQAPVDATYTALSVDPTTGDVADATSFVGTSENTAVYMSAEGLYVTYTQQADRGRLRIDFLLEQDRLPAWLTDRLTEIRGYNISTDAKHSEANRLLQEWYRTLDDDERRTVRTEIRNDYRSYLADYQRQLVTTGVVQVRVDDGNLSVGSVGTIPGKPLNQFSLSQHNGTLRITTTIPEAGNKQSRNDLYVLDAGTLDRRSAVQGMGVNERVYAVRYVEDTAYVVTFRRIDPFHVVDLSNPDDPEVAGELKLPGFSSYLHPVDDDHVLGIGEENGQVKAVLFDVSDPSEPVVADDYVLDSRWSAIADSHHAFLLDRQHEVFFLPTGNGGNVLDYSGKRLSLETTVDTDGAAHRAMYIDDYMYVFGTDELAVIDETTWNRTDTVALD